MPRWNNPLGTAAKVQSYLALPAMYFVLFDTLRKREPFPFRVRVWKVNPRADTAFRDVVRRWAARTSSGNFQLHPPCWKDTNVTSNRAGNLELPLLFEAQQVSLGAIDHMEIRAFDEEPGRCRAIERGTPS